MFTAAAGRSPVCAAQRHAMTEGGATGALRARSCHRLFALVCLGTLLIATAEASAHPCYRPCVRGRHMTCRYNFHVENYHSLSKACYGCPWNATDCTRTDCIAADGVPRALVVVNRELPGPSIQVCQGDRVEVTVHNLMPEQSTTVHWHGVQQRGSQYMDGVPFVTQCPIAPHSTFRYSFRADNPGTQFWHSHTGCQRADGAVGFFTVRVPTELDPHAALYDVDLPEHGLLVLDWTHQLAASKFLAHHHAGDDNKADAVLINGKGVYRRFVSGQGDEREVTYTPREVFKVQKGLRYRFRVVNAGFLNCPLELSVDNHTMLVIASDGFEIQPVRVDSLVSYAGERWDVIVEADQAVGSYWVRLHGLLDCGPRRAHEAAILRYEGADPKRDPAGPLPAYDVPHRSGLQVNALNRGSSSPGILTVAELQGLPQPPDPALKPQADVQLFVSYDFYALDNPLIHRPGLYGISQVANSPQRVFTPQLNHISLSLPPFPLLSARDRIPPGMLCNEASLGAQGRNCSQEFCECTHTVQVPLGGVLEIVLVDQGVRYDANHPFHLHGHAFRVLGLERLGNSTTVEEVQRLDKEGKLARNLIDPPSKDTVTVPDGGYTVLRVLADNPGYWLFHCHIEFHVELGMALIIKVGEHEDMPPVPRGFPQCGDWNNDMWLDEEENDDDERNDEDIVLSNNIGRAIGGTKRGALISLGSNPTSESLRKDSPGPSTEPSREATSSTADNGSSSSSSSTQVSPTTTAVDQLDLTTAIPDDSTSDGSVGITSTTDINIAETLVMDLRLDHPNGETIDGVSPSKFLYDHVTTKEGRESTPRIVVTTDNPLEAHTNIVERASPTPTAAPLKMIQPVLLSEYIMRVTPRRSDSRANEAWVIEDHQRRDLQYSTLQEPMMVEERSVSSQASTAKLLIMPMLVPILPIVLCVL